MISKCDLIERLGINCFDAARIIDHIKHNDTTGALFIANKAMYANGVVSLNGLQFVDVGVYEPTLYYYNNKWCIGSIANWRERTPTLSTGCSNIEVM